MPTDSPTAPRVEILKNAAGTLFCAVLIDEEGSRLSTLAVETAGDALRALRSSVEQGRDFAPEEQKQAHLDAVDAALRAL
jgi:hypothetical protein